MAKRKPVTWGTGELAPIDFTSAFYKNCRSVRKRGGKICQSCPFRAGIEKQEADRLIRSRKETGRTK
jgi:hypothetical protein